MARYCIAFYKGDGDFKDAFGRLLGRLQFRVIRASTRSIYTHCELVRSDGRPDPAVPTASISASGRDGGVREKAIAFDADRWDFVGVPWAPHDAWDRAARHLGKPYDYKAMWLSHLFAFNRDDPGAWFCSELCAYALRLKMPHALSPGALYRTLLDHTDTWTDGGARALRESGGRREGSGRRGWI